MTVDFRTTMANRHLNWAVTAPPEYEMLEVMDYYMKSDYLSPYQKLMLCDRWRTPRKLPKIIRDRRPGLVIAKLPPGEHSRQPVW